MTSMRRRDHNIFTNAASLLLCGVLAGVVVAGAAFPAVAMTGLAAKASSDAFAELPTSLDVPTPPQITYLYASDSKTLIGTFYDENRHDIPLSEIPQVMRDAIIAAEDQRFYQHNGVDIRGVLRAYLSNTANDDDTGQGASTLTMQYVRQAQTYGAKSPKDVLAATEETPQRKIKEIRLALGLEKRLSKDQILQNYLNIAAFGRGAYGIYAAAQVYFNKEPKDLTLAEAALLAGLPQAPSAYDPSTTDGLPKAQDRRSYVLTQMVKLGMISQEQATLANNEPIEVTGQRTPRDCIATTQNDWGFFCDYLYRWWADQTEFGVDAATRLNNLKSGGYRITSSLNVGVQASAKQHIEEQLATGDKDALMLAAIEPGTGYVRAMAVNRNFSLDDSANGESSDPNKRAAGMKGTYPNTTNPLLSGGGDVSGYKAGSTFKMFTMLAALENGYTLDYTINAVSPYKSKYIEQGSVSTCPDGLHWCPSNANPGWMNGKRDMWTGFGRSVNTYFVPLEERVGADKAIEMAQRLGVHFRNDPDTFYTSPDHAKGFGPFTLGITDTVPLELANAYATVAAEGLYCEPMPIVSMLNVSGQEVTDVVEPRCAQVVSQDVARAAADAARCPVFQGGGLGKCNGATDTINSSSIIGHPVIGKTGTSDLNWTANFVISSKQLAIAATQANPDLAEEPHPAAENAKHANNAATYTMRDALAGLPAIDFTPPPSSLAFGVKVNIPSVTCRSVADATRAIQGAGFTVSIDPNPVDSDCPSGTVARTDPSGSTSKGSDVSLVLSNGHPTTPTGGPTDPTDGGGPGTGRPGNGGGDPTPA